MTFGGETVLSIPLPLSVKIVHVSHFARELFGTINGTFFFLFCFLLFFSMINNINVFALV